MKGATIEQLASLSPILGLRVLQELEAEGIPATTTDMLGSGALGSIPGFTAPTITIWVADEADLEPARAVLERVRNEDLGEDDVSPDNTGSDE